jgi:hypothetical protein
MTESGETNHPGRGMTPEEAFALVGHEVRAEILRALSEARGGEGGLLALSFSELRSRVDPDIDSGQFNYHLQQLLGRFVERVEDGTGQLDSRMAGDVDDGYVLRPEGTILTRTIRANVGTGHSPVGPFDLGLDCYFCGTAVEATYGNAVFMARCPGCDYMYEYELVPFGGFDDDARATTERIAEYLRHRRLAFAQGSCPLCAHRLDTRFVTPEEMEYPRADRREVVVNRWCDHCGERDYLRIGEVLLREPALVAFCDAHGIDVTSRPLWTLEFVVTDRPVTVRSTDPWEVRFRLTVDGDTLELAVDEDLTVRRAADGSA